MGKTMFKTVLRTTKKEAPVAAPEQAEEAPVAAPEPIYTDASICRCLGIRRRVLSDARTVATKGKDWACVGEEVGMTKSWVFDHAAKNGLVPDVTNVPLEEVTGKFVSCRLVGTTPNHGLVQVELEASGKREFARVRNIMTFPIHYHEVFTCIRVEADADRHLEWLSRPNEVKY